MSSLKHRFEAFGGILALEYPPMLVHVDRELMRSLGYGPSPLWEKPESAFLSGPLEVHFSVTNACWLPAPRIGPNVSEKNDTAPRLVRRKDKTGTTDLTDPRFVHVSDKTRVRNAYRFGAPTM